MFPCVYTKKNLWELDLGRSNGSSYYYPMQEEYTMIIEIFYDTLLLSCQLGIITSVPLINYIYQCLTPTVSNSHSTISFANSSWLSLLITGMYVFLLLSLILALMTPWSGDLWSHRLPILHLAAGHRAKSGRTQVWILEIFGTSKSQGIRHVSKNENGFSK